MTEKRLKKWAEKEIKPRHKLEKIEPFRDALHALCVAAIEHGELPQWMLRGAMDSIFSKYK